MKALPAVLFTLLLLASMGGLGFLSGSWGYKLGRQALESINQPDSRPTNGMARRNTAGDTPTKPTFLKESDILAEVQARMEGRSGPLSERQVPLGNPPQAVAVSAPAAAEVSSEGFPIVATDQDVSIRVESVRRQGTMVVLAVQLTNDGPRPVEFLYSFMTVRNAEGKSLSASTDGLPTELGANGGYGAGEIRIPVELLEDSATVSLDLSDYPDQALNLKLRGIPVNP